MDKRSKKGGIVMTIDVNAETTELSKVLKLAEGYLSCERIIIQNITKQLDNDSTEESMLSYLENFCFFGDKIKTQEPDEDCPITGMPSDLLIRC
ncbi:MAG: hypothetical protein IPQ25_10485 [Chitinophagaceae bacterium]|nr:hypothetical protein [Chitinophagaceae bacterium]